MEICQVCGLPKELCACERIEQAERKIEVSVRQAKFRKLVTVVKGVREKEIEKIANEEKIPYSVREIAKEIIKNQREKLLKCFKKTEKNIKKLKESDKKNINVVV